MKNFKFEYVELFLTACELRKEYKQNVEDSIEENNERFSSVKEENETSALQQSAEIEVIN